jgi:hypothetical protein
MTYAVTNSEELKDGMQLIAENRNLKRELAECRRLLDIYKAAWVAQEERKTREKERAKREEEELKQRELQEAIDHVDYLMHGRDLTHGYLARIYGREKPRRGQRRTYSYHD